MKRTSRLLVAAVAVLGVLLATAGFTSEPGAEAATAAFILDILPQLMGGPPKNSFPRLSRCPHCMRAEASVGSSAQLRPLPADIDAHDPDWQQRLQAVMHSEPAVVRGLQYVESRRFGNMSGLNVPRLRELYRGRSVTTFTHMTHDTSAVDMSFDDFADRMNDEEEMLYARAMPDVTGAFNNFDLDWVAGTLWGRLWSWRFTQFTGGKPLQGRIGLGFVGSKHVWTQAHCDVGSSSFLMLHGRKRWVFFSPTQTRWMYPYGQYRNVAYNAGLDVFAPNLTEVPLFANVRGYEVVLQPGDVLFFPSFWWHGVQNLDDETVAVDLPLIDILGSWRRNAIFTLTSLLNPNVIGDSIGALLTGGSLRGVFFAGYRKEGLKEGE